MSLPVIDFQKLVTLTVSIQQQEIKRLDQALSEVGFIYLVNHSIDHQLLDKVFAVTQRFFSQPDAVKYTIDIRNSRNHRGYGAIGEERLNDETIDYKETFDMALDLSNEHPLAQRFPQAYGKNQYPHDADFIETLTDYYQQAFAVSQQLLSAMACALQAPLSSFTQHFNTHTSVLRAIHYPPKPLSLGVNMAGAHTDYGCITLLLQDLVGGLQVKHRTLGWIDAPPVPHALIVNVGDLMQRWTNDRYISTPHRVFAKQRGVSRYAIPFFVEPDYDASIECLEHLQTQEDKSCYEPVMAGEWVQQKLNATYQYKKQQCNDNDEE